MATRVTVTSSTLIDHIWSTQVENNIANDIMKTDISDHYPVLSVFKCDKRSQPTYITKRIFHHNSLQKVYKTLLIINWSPIEECKCPNNAYISFHDKFKSNFEKCFPEKAIKLNCEKERSPHIPQALGISIREKKTREISTQMD